MENKKRAEKYKIPFPTEIDTPDPVIRAAVEGKEGNIISKAKEIINGAGVLQLPGEAIPPVFFFMGEVIIA